MENLLTATIIYLCAAVVAVPVAKRLGLGSILGYLIAGLLIGPVLGLVGDENQTLMVFAEIGVVMMLFLVGLELKPRLLWDMRTKLLGIGGLQVLLTTVAVALLASYAVGLPWQSAVAIGLILALSSTAIVLQTLNEKGLLKSDGGQSSFAVLLLQDIAVIPILALMPLLALPELAGVATDGHDAHHSLSLMAGLPGWQVALINVVAISAVVIGGNYLSRPLFVYIARVRLQEIFTAAALLLVLGVTLLMGLVGLSPALGAFLAGVVLANSEFRPELESNIEPFKAILLGLFFITVGAGIELESIYAAGGMSEVALIVLAVLGLILLKAIILYILARVFRIPNSYDRWVFTLSLAQAGEFGFVLLAFATQNSILAAELANWLLVVVALSMLLTPLIFFCFERFLAPQLQNNATEETEEEDIEEGEIIIAGHGRFGQLVDRLLLASGYKTVVLEYQSRVIQGLRRFGVTTFYGDASRASLLEAAGIGKAKLLVIAIDDADKAVEMVQTARRLRPDIHIVARAWDRLHVYRLYEAGANDIVREVFDSALRAGRYALQSLGISEEAAQHRVEVFTKHDTTSLARLAAVWDPNVSVFENKKYIAMAQQIRDEVAQTMQSDNPYQGAAQPKAKPGRKPNKSTAAHKKKQTKPASQAPT